MQIPASPVSVNPHASLLEQVQARRDVLRRDLEETGNSASTRTDIEHALDALGSMLTGDLSKLSDVVSHDLTRWLDANKYLGVKADAAARAVPVAGADALVAPPSSTSDSEARSVSVSEASATT